MTTIINTIQQLKTLSTGTILKCSPDISTPENKRQPILEIKERIGIKYATIDNIGINWEDITDYLPATQLHE